MNKRALIKQLNLKRRRAIQAGTNAGDDTHEREYQKGYIQALTEAVKLVKMLPSPPLPPMPNDTEE